MKKNTMMRLASFLLIAVLITTSAISGTYAKYVTQGEGKDSARVAKWGITVDISGTLFGEYYYSKNQTDTSNEISASVQYSVDSNGAINDIKNIVAPGTKNSKGITLAVNGTPEVAYTLKYENAKDSNGQTIENETIWLGTGNYGVMVETDKVTADNFQNYYYVDNGVYKKATSFDGNYTGKWYALRDKAKVESKYEPITWHLNENGPYGSLENVMGYLVSDSTINAPTFGNGTINQKANDPINLNVDIWWEWPFEQSHDDADTILGNLMAYDANSSNYVVVKTSDTYVTCTELVDQTDYNLDVFFGATITVTQVD